MTSHQTDIKAEYPSEAELRRDVSIVTRLLNSLKILEYSGHVSARLPGGDTFLVQPRDMSRAEVAPDALIVCDLSGKALSGPAGERPPSEVYIHSEIYRARPDINAIVHFHHDGANVFTLVEDVELPLVKNHSIRWTDGIPVHPDPAHVNSPERGRALVETLGKSHALQIRAHGQVMTAENLPGLFIDSVHFIENAEAAYRAAAIGRIKPLTEADIASFSEMFRRDHHVGKLWNYYLRGALRDGTIPPEWAPAA